MNTLVNDTSPNPVQAARTLLKQLQEKYAVFRDCMPLAIGIDKQLIKLEPDINRKVLRNALRMHTHSQRYLKTLEKATHRFTLEGNVSEDVTDIHRTFATNILLERRKKMIEQRKIQHKAEIARLAAEKAEQERIEKLNQLTAKFSRNRS